MSESQIRYDVLVKDALRSVIRKILAEVAKNGLPDNHHFFITFLTEYPGVKISSRLKKLYPQQMTIVLQHQFWNLKVNDAAFEVSLSFSNVPETLVVPFNAIQIFLDPIAAFETTFDLPADASNNNQKDGYPGNIFGSSHISHLVKNSEIEKKAKTEKKPDQKKAADIPTEDTKAFAPQSKPSKKQTTKTLVKLPPSKSAEIVSLAEFRKGKD